MTALMRPDHASALLRPSPNFGERRDGMTPDIVLLHYTGMETGQGAEDWLANPASEVSSHYVVHEDGRIVQLVSEAARAWHAGQSSWHGQTDINSLSVGIEIVNPGHRLGYQDFPAVQIDAVIDLCRGIVARHNIPPQRVLAHSDVAPGRKVDPGERFPWARLNAAGIGHWVEPSPIQGGRFLAEGDRGEPVEALQAMLALYGYRIDVGGLFDAATATVVSAFQLHFRQAQVDGVADRSTIETLHRLCRSLPGAMGS